MEKKWSFNHIEHYRTDGAYYDFFSPDKFTREEIRRRYQQIFSFMGDSIRHPILEIGSGGGAALQELDHIKPDYYPLDIPSNNLIKIKETATFKVFPVSGDGYHLPFQSGSFRNVVISEVLEHVTQPLKILEEIVRVLEWGGNLGISTPYKEKITYQICIHCNKPTPTHSHIHSFDEKKLADLVRRAGLEPVKSARIINKVPNRLHLNIVLKKIPFPLWRVLDRAFNSFIHRPISLIMVARKR